MIILPGDTINVEENINTAIGPGIYKDPRSQSILPTSAGFLHSKVNKKHTNQVVYIDTNLKRYLPQTNDFVIGIVVGVLGEFYKVQLQDFLPNVLLSMMAFPNATKKNRPNLKNGQAVYARVSLALLEVETELECFDAETGKDGGFGLLSDEGYIFDVLMSFARELLFNHSLPVLEKLALRCQFEIAVGINGKVWLKCGDGSENADEEKSDEEMEDEKKDEMNLKRLTDTFAACKYIQRCQNVSVDEIDRILAEEFKR